MTDRLRSANAAANTAPGALDAPERALCLAGSSVLIANGLRQGGAGGLLQVAAGAWAGWRGYRGHCPAKARLCAQSSPVDSALASAVAVRSITVNKPLDEVLAFCNHPANIGALLPWVDTIEETAPGVYRWAVRGPGERTLHWVLEQHPVPEGDGLHWRTPADSRWPVEVQASLRLPRHGEGTRLRVLLSAAPFPSRAGQVFAGKLSRFADGALRELLQRVKQQVETGEAEVLDKDANDFIFVHPASPEGD
ncbi:SRPBCC family protein [Pseudomonas typographi]|uniref:Cyclase/dehydrase n=1 Tax=Pseudomonas typographi TaxID=2715964 RepID=A0ABR7Z424_9PSED|nr:SRPBCC family protein [Pseudomonas typographi]MBD1551971.1 hypothetical protein [Pseudomonas typographi]MBD1586535.1 hypothetical protein [Pseudomonas typographi]MBD1600036.1 hypothetical protein [Pseudomonas typographi]